MSSANGAKAVTWEATAKRVDARFFATHSASELWGWADRDLEGAGRLTHPLRYNPATDHYEVISYADAFRIAGAALNRLEDPNEAEFYCSGRASNEAAFLWQLYVRCFGTNNFPDCSNMCHEATSAGLPQSIGAGKGTVTLDDFEQADAIFCIGHNPGTNHPRMLSTPRDAARRGAAIVVINPMRERGLERFQSPQHVGDMLRRQGARLASAYHQIRVGGDMALLKGVMKGLLAMDALDTRQGGCGVIDRSFIAEHTTGFAELVDDLAATSWEEIERRSGVPRGEVESIAATYAGARNVIICYGMGITQHRHGTQNVQQIANLLLLRGNIGRPGAGICPLRGHSNVQGDRTVGITEVPSEEFLTRLDKAFGITSPRPPGHGAVEAFKAMLAGRSKAVVSLGGNLAVAMPDPAACFKAYRQLDLSVTVVTKFNRTCLLHARETLVVPCLGRTEQDVQASGPQAVTVEDSMSMVHASRGKLKPVQEGLLSEPAIIAGLAKATLAGTAIDWDGMVANYDRIRDKIAEVFPDFHNFNERVRVPLGFRLPVRPSNRVWPTPDGKARFIVHRGTDGAGGKADGAFVLTTIRSHDQYNTTIYGDNDRYRGIAGRRDVVFINDEDLLTAGITHGDRIDVVAGENRILWNQVAVAHPIARGSVAAYYPEANHLIALDDHDALSGTPAYKSVTVTLRPSLRFCVGRDDRSSFNQHRNGEEQRTGG